MIKEMHMFPGGNTSEGFKNYFDGIVPPWEEEQRRYVLKGGPGVGKNTLMRSIEKKALEKGYEVKYFHCASDPNSLDAIRIPELKLTMLDGTAPHIIDPVVPGAVDGIINLGVYLDEKSMEDKTDEIKKLFEENQIGYKKAFGYLKAAGSLEEMKNNILEKWINKKELKEKVQELLDSYKTEDKKEYMGFVNIFAAAITPDGYVDYKNSGFGAKKVIVLKGEKTIGIEFLKFAVEYVKINGYSGIIYYDPLLPKNPVHLLIREMDICISTTEWDEKVDKEIINLQQLISAKDISEFESEMKENAQIIEKLINKAIYALQSTKQIHDKIENIYKESMNFEELNIFAKQFIDDIDMVK